MSNGYAATIEDGVAAIEGDAGTMEEEGGISIFLEITIVDTSIATIAKFQN
jgi:hypothetical protein